MSAVSDKQRCLGIDVAKILAIFLVIVVHICGRVLFDAENSFNLLAYALLKNISYTCIDIFALASGYLCLTSSCRLSRIVQLWVTAVFWGVTILIICDIFGLNVTWEDYAKALMPIASSQYWFFTAYFMLYIFMPLINEAIKSIDRNLFNRFLIFLFVFMSMYSCFGSDKFGIKEGYSFLWLLVMYIVGAYIRRFGFQQISLRKCFFATTVFLLIPGVFIPALRRISFLMFGFKIPSDKFVFTSYVSPFIVCAAIAIFIGCLHIRPKHIGVVRLLKGIVATTFGVYLIHMQPFLWRNVNIPLLRSVVVESTLAYIFIVLGLSAFAFVLMVLMELLREKFFGVLKVNDFIARLDGISLEF